VAVTTAARALAAMSASPHARVLSPLRVAVAVTVAIAAGLALSEGLQPLGQTTVNGLVSGTYFALGAAGLTLVYGVLRLINFAHGDMLTFGAYVAIAIQGLDLPFGLGVAAAIAATAALGLLLERLMWRPMRRRRAGLFQLFLMSLGLAFLLRYTIQFFAGTGGRTIAVNVIDSYAFAGLRIGVTQLWVLVSGLAVLMALGLLLRATSYGRQIRALADDHELAETTGIDTARVVLVTWVVAGGLAGLAGVLYGASLGVITPELGGGITLSLFAAVIVGGIGNPYGALAGGLFIGVVQEWSTLVINSGLKVAVGFAGMIIVMILRPQGLLGTAPGTEG
jgi:neutral amino acid transport system permease protein